MRLRRGSFSDKLRKRPCGSSGERLRSACGASCSAILRKRRYVPSGDALLLNCAKRFSTARSASQLREALLNRPKGTLNGPKGTLNRAKRLSTARRALSTARSASQLPEAPLNLFLNKKYRIFLVVSRSCIIFAEIFDIDRNLNIYHYDRRKTDTGWR